MTVIHTGNTATTGFVVSADDTGDLVIKTGGSGGTTALSINDSQIATFVNQPVIPVPLFAVRTTTDRATSDQTWWRANFDAVDVDTHGWWDSANYRYVPQIAGYYQFNWLVGAGGTTIVQYYSSLWKNGVGVKSERVLGISANTSTSIGTPGSYMLYMNGSTDYVDARGWVDAASDWQIGAGSHLQGFLIRAA